MGRKSTIDFLPDDVRDQLITWMEDPAIDISTAHERVNSLLSELGLNDLSVSRSAVGRKAKLHNEEMQRLGEEMREAKANREAFYEAFGDELSDGGKFLAETLQAFIFKMNMTLHRLHDVPADELFQYSKTIKNMTGSVVQLEDALTKFTSREADIKKAATEEAAETAVTALSQSGLSAASVQQIKNEILGIR